MSEKKYQVSSAFILREIGGEAVLVPVGDVGELENSIISLNETYCFIWKQFQTPNSVKQVIQSAREQYEAPEGLIEKQIQESVQAFVERAVLEEITGDE